MTRAGAASAVLGAALAVLLLCAGCGGSTAAGAGESVRTPVEESYAAPPAPPSSGSGERERGEASYYAQSLAGRPTASGELYRPGEMTAAHRTLPFGTLVEVRRDDGRSVVVRINDRGPFRRGRVIDLSRRAAEEIGLVRDGVAVVEVRVTKVAAVKAKRRAR